MHVTHSISGGQLVPITFVQDAVADSQSAVAMNLVEVASAAALTVLGKTVPWRFDLVGIEVSSDSDRTAGTLTVDATINTTATGLQAVLNATTVNNAYTRAPRGKYAGAAGARIGVKLTTASWTPTTADVEVTVWVLLYLDGI